MIKKGFLILALVCCLPSLLLAQKEFKRYSEFGVRGSAFLIDHQINDPVNYPDGYGESIPFFGIAGGLRFTHVEQKNLGIIVELNYLQQTYNEDNLSLSVDAIQIPLLSHFTFSIGKSNIALNIGPQLVSYLNRPEELVLDKSILYGASGGLGLSYSIGKVVIGAEARYNILLPLNSDDYRGAIRGDWAEICLSIGFRKYKD